jgi:hypothetical protein
MSHRGVAAFSEDRRFRYYLSRIWNEHGQTMIVIGLNPSTADEATDDNTIRRCVDFAQRERCGALIMLNLFGFRSTDPQALLHDPDRVGPQNDDYIRETCADPDAKIVVAWGVYGLQFPQRVERVLSLIPTEPFCFGLTRFGAPRHPLYLDKATPLVLYRTALKGLKRRSQQQSSTTQE